MAITVKEIIDELNHSRNFFLKHLKNIKPEQLDWKPYPECKSIRETLQHLIVDDQATLFSLENNTEPDYEAYDIVETDFDKLLAMLDETHKDVINFLESKWESGEVDGTICLWGIEVTPIQAVARLAAEDSYHTGQVAFVRLASDPSWNYYEEIYDMVF